jgi:hypothetical protein
MRKTCVYASLLVAVVGFLFFFAGSCTTSDGLPPYYIKFNFDGNEVVFDLGMTGIENDPFASVTEGDGYSTLFFATPLTTDVPGIPDNYILIRIYDGEDPSLITYPRTYAYLPSIDDSLEIEYRDSGSGYYYTLDSGSLTVTSFGEVGEAISGTFSATLSYPLIQQGVKVAAPTIQITEGEFKVKRVDDGYSLPFPD